MIRNRKGQQKRKASRWGAAPCLHGNKSIDASVLELTFDPNVVSPKKRLRLSPTEGSTVSLFNLREGSETGDFSPNNLMDNESDKENTPLFDWHGKNNPMLMGSYIQLEENVSYLHQKGTGVNHISAEEVWPGS